ncbi:MAG: LysR family transcriptional regulator [Wenzhouxiangellaceae bacterium]|nr:LysR family transcriptional regulator [Wenzhouxiangellaceae bacterium]
MFAPRITLEQWRALVAVVDAGGYARAAEQLNKSQSTVTYAVQRIASLLDVALFESRGRRAVLTPAGAVLYRRGKVLLGESARLERVAQALARGQESELRLAVEIVFPTWLLLEAMRRFGEAFPDVRVELHESVLGGTEELLEGRVDLAVGSRIPGGFAGEPLLDVRFVCAAAPCHPLHQLGRPLGLDDLKPHRHLVVRDSGTRPTRRVLALEAEQRWTVSHKSTSIRAACMGLGFAWFAESNIRDELARGDLVPLPLADGGVRHGQLYLIHADPDAAGPGARRFTELLREVVKPLSTA